MRGNDLRGKNFGKLIVVELSGKQGKSLKWLCKCDCGNTKEIVGYQLTRGTTISCGCYKKDRMANLNKKHDMTNTKLFSLWFGMKRRCYDKTLNGFSSYGGRGIKVCDEWKNSFESFAEWAKNTGYEEGLTIERKNVDGDYEPLNCSWITMKEQQWNKQKTIYLLYKGERKPLCEWCEILGVNKNTARSRYYRGWSADKILSL